MILGLLAQVGTEAAAAGAVRKRPRLRRIVHGTALALPVPVSVPGRPARP